MNANTRRTRPAHTAPAIAPSSFDTLKAERDALVGLCQSLVWSAGGRRATADLVKEAVVYLDSIGEGRSVG